MRIVAVIGSGGAVVSWYWTLIEHPVAHPASALAESVAPASFGAPPAPASCIGFPPVPPAPPLELLELLELVDVAEEPPVDALDVVAVLEATNVVQPAPCEVAPACPPAA